MDYSKIVGLDYQAEPGLTEILIILNKENIINKTMEIDPLFFLILYCLLSLLYDISNSQILIIVLNNKNFFLIFCYCVVLLFALLNIITHLYFFKVRTDNALKNLDKVLSFKIYTTLLISFFNYSSDGLTKNNYVLFVVGGYFFIIAIVVTYCACYSKLKEYSEGLSIFRFSDSSYQREEINRHSSRSQDSPKQVLSIEIVIDNNYQSFIYNCELHSDECDNCRCTICLENMNNKEVYKMNCNHIFDKKCFLEYVNNCENKKITCPNCRSYII